MAKATKPVHSQDPRKAQMMANLKAASGASKVTRVQETDTHYLGSCMWLGTGSGLGTGLIRIEKTTGAAENRTTQLSRGPNPAWILS